MLRTRNGDAGMKVFVSYSHAQSDWVQDRVVPVLEAGGAEVLVDHSQVDLRLLAHVADDGDIAALRQVVGCALFLAIAGTGIASGTPTMAEWRPATARTASGES